MNRLDFNLGNIINIEFETVLNNKIYKWKIPYCNGNIAITNAFQTIPDPLHYGKQITRTLTEEIHIDLFPINRTEGLGLKLEQITEEF